MSDEVWLNIGCGPYPAPKPWINVDQRNIPEADVVNPSGRPVDVAEPDSVHRVYLGHVLEHVRWEDVPEFLWEVRRLLRPGGSLGVVGPDVWKALSMWRTGNLSRRMLAQIMESHAADEGVTGTRHEWNCHADRLAPLFEVAGFVNVQEWDIMELPGPWPVTARPKWQCAFTAEVPA